jgi:pyruvyltransferase
MKTITGYWISNVDNKYTNFGDILSPYIFSKFGMNLVYEEKNPSIYGIGSLLHMCPNDYQGYVWSTGFMYNTKTLHLKNDPICVRGKLSKKQFINDTSNTHLGDGGLILEKIYEPKIRGSIKYTLGIMPNYCDIVNMRDDPIEKFDVFNNPDVIMIDPRNYIETVINDIYSCENIITSSLHGLVVADSYGINNGCFKSRETNIAIHHMQDSFKFKDYYSVFDMDFNKNDSLLLNKNTTFEQCLSICKPVNKPNMESIKQGLIKSIETFIK